MHRFLALGCGAALALAGLPAGASIMEVRYSLTPFIQFGGSSPTQTSSSGTLDLAYSAVGSVPASSTGGDFTAVPGPVGLLAGSLQATGRLLNPTGPLGLLEIKLRLTLSPATGSLLETGTLHLPAIPAQGRMTLHCIVGSCGPVPFSVPQVMSFPSLVFAWTAAGHLDTALHASALVPHSFLLSPALPVGFSVTGASEVSRHFVPEPGTLPTTLTGLAALALLVSRRRARR